MRNKLFLLIMASILLCGCSNSTSKEVKQIQIYGDSAFVSDNTAITIPKDYSFKDFSKVYGDDTITITINYKKVINN